MNVNDLIYQYRNSQEKPVEINGNTVRIYPSDIGPGCNFANAYELDQLIQKALKPTSSNVITLSFSPGVYNSVDFSSSSEYINVNIENPNLTEGLTSGNDGYSLSGNTLTVTSVGGAGDRFATMQDAYDAIAVDDLLGEPLVSNQVYVELSGINFEQSRVAVESVADVDGTDSTITTETEHGLKAGDYIRLAGMTVSGYDSPSTVAYEVKTVPTDTTFTIEMTYSATATGTAIKQGVLTTSNDYVGVIVNSNVTNLVVE